MTIHLFKILILSLLIATPSGHGQVYKFIDKDGNVTYSDTPPAEQQDMQPAELPDIFIQPGVEVPEKVAVEEYSAQEISISISSPAEETTILGHESSFGVSAATSRKPSNGEQIRLIVNGSVHATATTPNWTVTNLIRGEYVLSAEVIDKNGKTIASSRPVRIFVQRHIAR